MRAMVKAIALPIWEVIMSQWITEEQTPHLRLSAEAEEVLYSGESEFQKIEVFKSKEYGMMLALDGVFQTSEREEFIYHEMIAHVPLFLHPNPERVLIIGGGDGENGVGKVAGNVPVVMAKVFESMKEATGIDLSEIINADSYDAKVNRNVNVTGLDGVNLVVNADTDKNGEKTEN